MIADSPRADSPIVPRELHGRRRPPPLSRADRSPLAMWYAEVDRTLLAMILGLMAIGLLAVAVASPVGARAMERLTAADDVFPDLYFLWRQIFWVVAGICVMLLVGMRSKVEIRRLVTWGLIIGVVALVAVLLVGSGAKGSVRWLGSGIFRVQPSEFLKPVFAVAVGWLLSCRVEDPKLPVFSLTFALTALIAVLLMLETDFGQTVLYLGTWTLLAYVAGISTRILAGLGIAGAIFAVATYFTYSTARLRVNEFFGGGEVNGQADKGFETLTASGLIGSGPFTGTHKNSLPEAHTDYIFSVIGEEFGLIACAAILLLYVALIVRVVQRLREERDQFVILAGTGLIGQFAGQVFINIAMNLQVGPTKGMTLPFISYGGSSMIALSIGMGMLLAFTRRNPFLKRSPYIVEWGKK